MILDCFEYNQHFVAMMNIINRARRCNLEGKFEKHHIIPRCFYKKKGLEVDNSSSNLVHLTLEEHRKVHQLAYLCAKDFMKSSLDYAQRMMNRKTTVGRKLSEEHRKQISEAKKGTKFSEDHRKKMSESMKGENNPFYGKTHSEETKHKMSDAKKGNTNAKGKHWKLINGKRKYY